MNEQQRASYLGAEHAESAELKKFTDQQPDGIHKELLGLLHWQLSKAAKEGKGALVKDTATAINAVQKSALQHSLLLGELWSPADRAAFFQTMSDSLALVLKRELPDSWEDVLDEIADEFARLQNETTAKAKIEAPKRITLK